MNSKIGFVLLMVFIHIISLLFSPEAFKNNASIPPPIKNNSTPELDALSLDYELIFANQNVKHSLPGMKLLFKELYQTPNLNQNLARSILKSKNNFVEILHHGFRMLGATAGGFGPPVMGIRNDRKHEFNSKNVDEKFEHLREKIGLCFIEETDNDWKKIPSEFRNVLLKLIYEIDDVAGILEQFREPIISDLSLKYPDFKTHTEELLRSPWETKQLYDFAVVDIIAEADLKKLSFASRLLSEGIRNFMNHGNIKLTPDFEKCILNSKWGVIGIYGTKDDIVY